jgi:hypothetical protein
MKIVFLSENIYLLKQRRKKLKGVDWMMGGKGEEDTFAPKLG